VRSIISKRLPPLQRAVVYIRSSMPTWAARTTSISLSSAVLRPRSVCSDTLLVDSACRASANLAACSRAVCRCRCSSSCAGSSAATLYMHTRHNPATRNASRDRGILALY
jgi:hypothetical protein